MEVKEAHELKKKEVQKMQDNIDEINNELKEVRDKRDMLYDEKYQVEAVVDEQKDKIEKLELEVRRAKEDVECRKMIIEELGSNMMHHERESAEMAQKLTLLKNQIMENDTSNGLGMKYTAVRVGTLRYHPCSFSFVQGADPQEYFMVVDSKQATTTINIDHVDSFQLDPDSARLVLVYHIPNDEGKLVKKTDAFECAETDHLMKTFAGVRNKTVGLGMLENFSTVSSAKAERRNTVTPKSNSTDLT